MKEKIIALYIRLSVEDRDLDELKTASVSIQNQKVHLRNFLMCHPETASGEIREFIDAPDIIGLKQNPTKRASL